MTQNITVYNPFSSYFQQCPGTVSFKRLELLESATCVESSKKKNKLENIVADPDRFDADLDPDPTSEKTRMRIRIRILDRDPDLGSRSDHAA
jgi:hypothetical protein